MRERERERKERLMREGVLLVPRNDWDRQAHQSRDQEDQEEGGLVVVARAARAWCSMP